MPEESNLKIEYATFTSRLGAYLLDGLIVAGFALLFNVINIATFKSFWVYLPIVLLSILYKPYLESRFGATLGKMVLQIKVTDWNFEQIGFKQSLLRSLIFIVPALHSVPIYYLAFNNPILANTDNFFDFAYLYSLEYPFEKMVSNLTIIIVVIDLIVLLSDKTKTQRSLHDRIARTYVIIDNKSTIPKLVK